MTSQTNFTISKFDEVDLYPNGTLPNRLLSPITEHSADTQQTYSDTSKKSSESVLSKTKSPIDELNEILLPKCHQYITYFYHIQTYLNVLQKHFKALSIIVSDLRKDRRINHVIEPIEIRMLQMHAKRNQIDNLLNKSSIKTLLQQILSSIHQSKLTVDYNEFLTSIQLNMNQKTTLIDHLMNEYRYKKYQLHEYTSKTEQRHQLIIKLTNQIGQFIVEHDRILKQVNSISIINEHNRQCIELTELSHEYEQVSQENYLLTAKAEEKLQKLSKFMSVNHF
ncbi:unnamed protein product [Adineta ricciae]|uniref:Uncharacterized protein n=1 Tax=Adineta ricciae TaxID=249248 RepID=A0A814V394_ADIRI|nr:unnamed protein product [Adineta ricciae]CAF1183678.1 unnamed protein product [Adineta ricciae]